MKKIGNTYHFAFSSFYFLFSLFYLCSLTLSFTNHKVLPEGRRCLLPYCKYDSFQIFSTYTPNRTNRHLQFLFPSTNIQNKIWIKQRVGRRMREKKKSSFLKMEDIFPFLFYFIHSFILLHIFFLQFHTQFHIRHPFSKMVALTSENMMKKKYDDDDDDEKVLLFFFSGFILFNTQNNTIDIALHYQTRETRPKPGVFKIIFVQTLICSKIEK